MTNIETDIISFKAKFSTSILYTFHSHYLLWKLYMTFYNSEEFVMLWMDMAL